MTQNISRQTIRGGSWLLYKANEHWAYRGKLDPDSQLGSIGFRVLSVNKRIPEKTLRGGSWDDNQDNVRSAGRGRNNPGSRYLNFGFRVLSYTTNNQP